MSENLFKAIVIILGMVITFIGQMLPVLAALYIFEVMR